VRQVVLLGPFNLMVRWRFDVQGVAKKEAFITILPEVQRKSIKDAT
jgi:hypothetical protein